MEDKSKKNIEELVNEINEEIKIKGKSEVIISDEFKRYDRIKDYLTNDQNKEYSLIKYQFKTGNLLVEFYIDNKQNDKSKTTMATRKIDEIIQELYSQFDAVTIEKPAGFSKIENNYESKDKKLK